LYFFYGFFDCIADDSKMSFVLEVYSLSYFLPFRGKDRLIITLKRSLEINEVPVLFFAKHQKVQNESHYLTGLFMVNVSLLKLFQYDSNFFYF
jgi:hypothetical protein